MFGKLVKRLARKHGYPNRRLMMKKAQVTDNEGYKGYVIQLRNLDWNTEFKVFLKGKEVNSFLYREDAKSWIDLQVSERARLTEELRLIEGSYEKDITPAKQRRAREIIRLLNQCRCRHCDKVYDERKARGDWKGFCSAKCTHARARYFGWRKGGSVSEYTALKNAKCIGSVFVVQ